MHVDSPLKLRNIALVGHNHTGKTTLASAMLFTSGVTTRLQRVEDGNTVTDFDPEETARGISIGLATCFAPWNQHKINLIDCPGYGIFLSEIKAGMRAADAALLCLNPVAGVEVTTEKVLEIAQDFGMPMLIHLTRMDRENAELERPLQGLEKVLGRGVLPVQLPIGKEANFSGVVDLVKNTAILFDRDGNGRGKEGPIPDDIAEQAALWRGKLMEAVAETNDSLMEKFFESGSLSQGDLQTGLQAAVRDRALFPVTVGSALHGLGTSALLDSIVSLLPAPNERNTPLPITDLGGAPIEIEAVPEAATSALVFKTLTDPFSGKVSLLRVVSGTLRSDSAVWNSRSEEAERLGSLHVYQGKQGTPVPSLVAGDIGGIAKLKTTHSGDTLCGKERPLRIGWIDIPPRAISYAIEPKAKGDEEKIGEALARLIEEDPSLEAGRSPSTGEFLLAGSGALHLEIAVARLKQRYKVEVILHPPKVPYRETVQRPADGHGRHKKQSGGRGQFADCKIKIEPLERGGDFEFEDEIFGGAIPQNFRPAVEKGIVEAASHGYLAGYPVVDFRVRLLDGQYHDVDSSELAFKIAGSLAFKDAMAKAAATILEPVMNVEISTSEEFMGDIMSDLSQRRGRMKGVDVVGSGQLVKALVPMAEMLDYAPALRSITQGRGSFTMAFSHYEEVPRNLQEKIVQQVKTKREEQAAS
jgi:elongation factor G